MIRGPYYPTRLKQGKAVVGDLFGKSQTLGSNFPSPKNDTGYDKKWAYALSIAAGWTYVESQGVNVDEGQAFVDEIQYYIPKCIVQEIKVMNEAMLVVATAFFIQTGDVTRDNNGNPSLIPNNRAAILAFRGTEPMRLMNWLTDGDTMKYPFCGGMVHSGFFHNVEALWADIADVVDTAVKNGLQELYITGHSLGGAMAVLTAAKIFDKSVPGHCTEQWRSKVRGIYTYGQPMVGDLDFEKASGSFSDFLYRHVYANDMVPCLPPKSLDPTFVHFGKRLVADEIDNSWSQNNWPDRRVWLFTAQVIPSIVADFFVSRIEGVNDLRSLLCRFTIRDHYPRNYTEVCRNSLLPKAAPRATELKPQAVFWQDLSNAVKLIGF